MNFRSRIIRKYTRERERAFFSRILYYTLVAFFAVFGVWPMLTRQSLLEINCAHRIGAVTSIGYVCPYDYNASDIFQLNSIKSHKLICYIGILIARVYIRIRKKSTHL